MRFGWLWIMAGFVGSCFAAAPLTREPAVAEPQPGSTSGSYNLRLTTLVDPRSGPIGMILKVRVNGGPPLRLLLDSGAEDLVLSRSAAHKSGLIKSGSELDLVGVGTSVRTAGITTAGLEIDKLAFRDCPIVMAASHVAEGVDGVVPLSLFAGFLLRLDIPRRILELEPYRSQPQTPDPAFIKATRQRDLLFLQSRLPQSRDAYLLLDTGSSYNVISNAATSALPQARAQARPMPLIGAGGNTDGRLLPGRLTFQVGGSELVFNPVVAMDLAEMSRRHGIEVFGVIGYPALALSAVTVNYRESLVHIQAR
jgi:aspartyl protease